MEDIRIGECCEVWQDIDNNNKDNQFCVRSKHTLHACGTPHYNVLPSNTLVPVTYLVPSIGKVLRYQEYRLNKLENTLAWRNLDEQEDGE